MESLLLTATAPMDLAATLGFLGRRAIPGVESFTAGRYARTLLARGGPARVTLTGGSGGSGGSGDSGGSGGSGGPRGPGGSGGPGGPGGCGGPGGRGGPGGIQCDIEVTDPADRAWVILRVRRLLDLDADGAAIDARLGADPALGALVAARPGLRAPGAADGFELAIRAVVGQQISVSGAATILGRIAAEHGSQAFDGPAGRLFPTAAQLAAIDPTSLPMPRARGRTVLAIAAACAAGDLRLEPDSDAAREHAALLALPGIGPWTADYIRMRALGDRDVLLATDLGVRKSAAALGLDLTSGRPEWGPWRSYATHHLWAAGH